MDEGKNLVPYIVHESAMARMERTQRRLWILCIIAFCFLVGTNAAWIWYESQFEDVVTTTTEEIAQDVDTGHGDATVTGIGNIYGESETNR